MKVYLVRHGEANQLGDKELSIRGKKQVELVAKKLDSKKIQVDEIFHSGKTRAKETCEILVKNNLIKADVKVSEFLSPNSDIEIWAGILNRENKNFLLVGHLPFLSDLAYYLTGKQIEFINAEIVCLEKRDSTKWEFCWKIKP